MTTTPPQPPEAQAPTPAAGYKPPKPNVFRRFTSYIGVLVFILSLVMNVYLVMLMVTMSAAEKAKGMSTRVIRDGEESQTVAVYEVAGIIDNEAAADFVRFFRAVNSDKNVKAVVLRVNSPGGTVAASTEIHYMVKKLKQAGKKVIVSMGGVAASGGYMISLPADEIYAQPSTITSSIGVIAQVPNLEGTLDKIGVKMMIFKSTNAYGWKDEISLFRTPEPRQRKRFIALLDSLQGQFEEMVREGRGSRLITKKETYTTTTGKGKAAKTKTFTVTAPLNGKTYLADQALKFGLIDKIGYLDVAIDRAGELANLSKPHVVRYAKSKGLLAVLLEARTLQPLEIAPLMMDEIQTPRILLLWKGD